MDVVPVVPRILDDTPVALVYLQRLFGGGLPTYLQGSDGSTAAALHGIVQPTLARVLFTDTGSLVADRMLLEQGLSLE
ncbi:hypothetical protein GPECTOR_1g834 [Gonium pectorale]|uniref:Uncharacterized protein n=1 Tax=Gonium pectorale TaxID=33097 RepID=A0A150H4H6_GONPE|nr:hypothetical protein GPECTOR_1g834 [Gonium pectorale]|eukprot:KXZ56925.1 hypothetical protein GPECTOR_1g834 [Gonium pectorale]